MKLVSVSDILFPFFETHYMFYKTYISILTKKSTQPLSHGLRRFYFHMRIYNDMSIFSFFLLLPFLKKDAHIIT